ncbi:MAG: hypothetical protein ACJ741_09375, partial [Pyrinomonadaceae bacterium]
TLAPGKTFGGMTLAQFQEKVEAARDARRQIDDLEARLTQAIAERDEADENVMAKVLLVVAGVVADPNEGPNSALYAEMGYTRKNERKSGLTRKNHKTPIKP